MVNVQADYIFTDLEHESNTGNPAARAYMGTSAAAERGMVT